MKMPFQTNKKTNHNQKNNSLHTLHKLSSPNDKKYDTTERVSSFISQKASLTVETALVLPLFLFAVCFMMYFTEVVRIQAEVGNEIYKQSKELSLYAYVYDRAKSNEIIASGKVENVVTGMLSNLYVKSKVNGGLKDQFFERNNIENGMSLILSSYLQEDDMIDIVALYRIKIPCNFFHLNQIRVIQRARVRAWTGYNKEKEEKTKEEVVYITPHGSVYHKDRFCTHISLSVTQINAANVQSQRNDSGGKYYECEICGDEPSTGSYYITQSGDRYHKIKNCRGIKRDVTSIVISQVEGRAPCQRCGN